MPREAFLFSLPRFPLLIHHSEASSELLGCTGFSLHRGSSGDLAGPIPSHPSHTLSHLTATTEDSSFHPSRSTLLLGSLCASIPRGVNEEEVGPIGSVLGSQQQARCCSHCGLIPGALCCNHRETKLPRVLPAGLLVLLEWEVRNQSIRDHLMLHRVGKGDGHPPLCWPSSAKAKHQRWGPTLYHPHCKATCVPRVDLPALNPHPACTHTWLWAAFEG